MLTACALAMHARGHCRESAAVLYISHLVLALRTAAAWCSFVSIRQPQPANWGRHKPEPCQACPELISAAADHQPPPVTISAATRASLHNTIAQSAAPPQYRPGSSLVVRTFCVDPLRVVRRQYHSHLRVCLPPADTNRVRTMHAFLLRRSHAPFSRPV